MIALVDAAAPSRHTPCDELRDARRDFDDALDAGARLTELRVLDALVAVADRRHRDRSPSCTLHHPGRGPER